VRILLVDDDRENVASLEQVLQEAGYETVAAGDGEEALKLALSEPPDLAISEVLLPTMDGLSLLRAWLRNPGLRSIPFAILTGSFTGAADEAGAHALGAIRYWKKPMDPKAFVEEVDGVIQMRRDGMIGQPPPEPAPAAHGSLKLFDTQLVLRLKRDFEEAAASCERLRATLQDSGPMLVGVEIPPPDSERDEESGDERRNAAYRISDAVHRSPNLDELFKAIHETIRGLMEAGSFCVALRETEQDAVAYPYDVSKVGDESVRGLNRFLIGHVLESGEPFIGSPDAIQKIAADEAVAETGPFPLAWLGVPLKAMGKSVGVLAIYTRKPGFLYSREDAEILGFVSTQVALAIDRKRAEAEMLLLTSAVEQVSEAIFITDREGYFVYVNPAFEYQSGYTRSELSGESPEILKDPQTEGKDFEELWQTARNGLAWCGRLAMRRRDGRRYVADAAVSPVKNDLGDVAAFVSRNSSKKPRRWRPWVCWPKGSPTRCAIPSSR